MSIVVETLQVVLKANSSKAASALKKVAIAAAGVVAIYKLLDKAVESTLEAWAVQEKSLIKIRASLKAHGREVEGNTRQLEAFTSTLQRQTNIGDEVTLSLAAQAIAMGATTEESMRATEAAVGLSDAMGLGLDAALRAVRNAQEGNYQQLQRYIPALKGVTDETEAWDIINKAAESGLVSLEAQTKTLEGAITASKNSLGDMGEQIGRFIAANKQQTETVSAFSTLINRLTDRMKQQNDELEAFTSLSKEQQQAIKDTNMTYQDYQRNLEMTSYWTARLAAATKEVIALSSEWTSEKSRDYWREYTAGIISANTNMDALAQIEYNRAEALKAANTEYKDFNAQIERQVNLYYDEQVAALQLAENEKQITIVREQQAEQNRILTEQYKEQDIIEEELHRKKMERIQAQKDAVFSMYSSMKSIVQMYYQNEIAAAGDNEEKLEEIREKQFKTNKAFAIADTIINTAAAIVKVLDQAGIYGIPLAIAMGALGAAQVALIASTNPSFADGTPPGGYVVPPGYNGDNFPVSAKSGEVVNISRAGESSGVQEIVIMLDGMVLARSMTDLIGARQIIIRQEDIVA